MEVLEPYANRTALRFLDVLPDVAKAPKVDARSIFVAQRLARIPNGLSSISLLQNLAIIYAPHHSGLLQNLTASALATSPALLTTLSSEVVPAFIEALSHNSFREGDFGAVDELYKTAYCLVSLLQCGGGIIDVFARRKDLILAIAECYQLLLPNRARVDITSPTPTIQRALLAKVQLIDAFHMIIEHMISASLHDVLYDSLFALLDISTASSGPSSALPFVNVSLLADYEAAYHLSATLESLTPGAAASTGHEADPRTEYIIVSLHGMTGELDQSSPGGLSVLLDPSDTAVPPTHSSSKGKGKAVALPVRISISRVPGIH